MLNFFRNKENRGFFSFWLAQLVSQFGDRLNQMALVGLVSSHQPGSAFELAKLLSFTIIPVFVVGPIAGVFVDRWDRRTTLMVCDFIRGFLALSIPFMFLSSHNIIPIYVVVFLIFTLSRFYVPAKMSFIPEIVDQKDLHIANSLVSTTGMIALVAGALLGGLVVEYTGSKGGFISGAITFFVSATLVFSIGRISKFRLSTAKFIDTSREMISIEKNIFHEIKEGIQYIQSQKEIRSIIYMMAILFAAAGAIYVLIIIFIQQTFNSVTKDLGFLAVPLGIGLFLGSMAYARWGQKADRFKTMFWCLILGGAMIGFFSLCVASTHERWIAMALALILGFVTGPIVIAANTVVQEVCSQTMSGKVFSALEFVMHLAFLVAMFVSSILAEHLSCAWVLFGVGAIFMGVGISGLSQRRKV